MVVRSNSQVVYSRLLFMFLLAVAGMPTNRSSIAKPGCKRRCGGVSIPYPFGIGDEHCYYNKAFEITCDDSRNPPIPVIVQNSSDYIKHGDPSASLVYYDQYQVLDLTLDFIRINASAPPYCYNQTTGLPSWTSEPVYYLSNEGPFTFSNTRNQLAAISCDSVAYIPADGDGDNNFLRVVCSCETTIPKGLKSFQVRVKKKNTNSSWNRNECSHAVVVEREFRWFNELGLGAGDRDLWFVPVILDWAIGRNTTCEEAKHNNFTYACGQHTHCVDSDKSHGYKCKCSSGYQGNPYLQHGCQAVIPAPPPPPKASTSYVIAKEGCRDRCGNVSIPYPFGIGSSHCYLDYPFEIICNDSNNPPLPLLQYTKYLQSQRHSKYSNYWYEVLQFTSEYVRVNVFAPANCYNKTTGQANSMDMSTFLLDGHFTFSNTRNKLIAVGCEIFAYIAPDIHSQNYRTGCESRCVNGTLDSLPSCLGDNSCCQTTIPKGLRSFFLRIDNLNTFNGSDNPNGCNNVFLIEQEFPGLEELDFSREDLYVPVIIDWAIGNTPCKEAQTNMISYACGGNTYCVESNTRSGYRCKCLDGYRGNPYLLNGCQDIDECKESDVCGEEVACINVQGSYKCGLDKERLPLAMIVSLGIGLATVLVLMLVAGFWLSRQLKKRKQMAVKQNHFKRNGGLLLKQKISSNDGRVEIAAKIFLTEELNRATDNFNQSRIIGKGGFGTVYKGMLSDGRIVAIKKSKLVDESQVDQFINEVAILSQINHRHIVKLLGCCLETQVPLLVYEFVSKGTLSYHLHGKGDRESSISWKDRLRIAAEVAGALAYLHSEASIPIFHRDIKSCNILLDENYKAKVSDFGISRSIPLDKTHLTTLVQGTFGYLDPEYFHSSQFTDKSDVYSFGVVLLELLTGQRAISQIRSEEERSLAIQFISSMKENRLFELLEAGVVKEGDKDEILVVAKLAKKCLKLNGKKRPTMREIAATLDRVRKIRVDQSIEELKLKEREDCLIGDVITSSYPTGAFEFEESEDSSLIIKGATY